MLSISKLIMIDPIDEKAKSPKIAMRYAGGFTIEVHCPATDAALYLHSADRNRPGAVRPRFDRVLRYRRHMGFEGRFMLRHTQGFVALLLQALMLIPSGLVWATDDRPRGPFLHYVARYPCCRLSGLVRLPR
jgi:hypothetical protein